jgi:hypothetical protein
MSQGPVGPKRLQRESRHLIDHLVDLMHQADGKNLSFAFHLDAARDVYLAEEAEAHALYRGDVTVLDTFMEGKKARRTGT